MPKTLILLRHAEAEKYSEKGDEFRALTDFGEAQAYSVADYIKRNNIPIDLIMSSDAVRAFSTGLILIMGTDYDPFIMYPVSEIYKSSPADLIKLVSRVKDESTAVMVIGHNPTITNVLNDLLVKTSHLYEKAMNHDVTAKLVILHSKAETWSAFPTAECTIKDVFYPEIH